MTEEILINATPRETRVARLENGALREILIERAGNKGIVGNIYLGTVVRILPGIQAAFVDIGLERTAFLHARDLAGGAPDDGRHDGCQQPGPEASITSLLRQGEKLMLQAVKNPLGDKGARMSARVSIPSRCLVYLPGGSHTSVSRRIEDPAERESLASVLTEIRQQTGAAGGFILRTAAKDAAAEEIRADMAFLLRRWERILKRQREQSAPALLHRDLPLAMRTVRDLAWRHIDKVRIDCGTTCRQVVDFAAELTADARGRIEHYAGARPIFDLYEVEDHIGKALARRVRLQSGGHLIFDQTEAMTTVDINTGSFVGARNREETIFQTNLEAAGVLARQLGVRNIGGIIIVDFIDMGVEAHRAQVMQTLARELACDPVRPQVSEMSPLGLVEITRKRNGASLERLMTEPCPACDGRGAHKTAESTCYEIFRQLLRAAHTDYDEKRPSANSTAAKYRVVASRAVVDRLRENESDCLADLQKSIGKTIELHAEPNYRQGQFDVVPT